MKVRTPRNECIVELENGDTLKAVDHRGTYFAIKRLRQFVDARLQEQGQGAEPREQAAGDGHVAV